MAEVDGYSSTDHYLRDNKTSTAEFRLVSKPEHKLFSGTTSWVAGLYLKNDQEDLVHQYTYLDSNFYSSFEAKTIAIYGQFVSQFNEQLSLTSGIRVEQRDSDYVNSDSLAFSPDDNMVG